MARKKKEKTTWKFLRSKRVGWWDFTEDLAVKVEEFAARQYGRFPPIVGQFGRHIRNHAAPSSPAILVLSDREITWPLMASEGAGPADFFAEGKDGLRDWAFALMASCDPRRVLFVVPAGDGSGASGYFKRARELGELASARYVATATRQFRDSREYATHGARLPGRPTPELRWFYDSAQRRVYEIKIKTLRSFGYTDRDIGVLQGEQELAPVGRGFVGGEYCWAAWPMTGVYLYVDGFGLAATSADLERPRSVAFRENEKRLERLFHAAN